MEPGNELNSVEDWIKENKLAEILLEKSNIKEGELKALLLYYQNEETSFSDVASKLNISKSGAWKRWKKGYKKIIESFYTLELAIYGGVLDPEATKFIIEDLQDYLRLALDQGDIEGIRARLEKRLAEMEESGF